MSNFYAVTLYKSHFLNVLKRSVDALPSHQFFSFGEEERFCADANEKGFGFGISRARFCLKNKLSRESLRRSIES